MKKLVLIVLLMTISSNAVQMYAEPVDISFETGYVDPTSDDDEIQRSPIMTPRVAIDGYMLSFFTPCNGCELQLLDEEGNVVYNVIIPDGSATLTLPSYLSGDYEIQIIRGNYLFWGYIYI